MYLGTPAIAVPPLVALVEAGFEVAAVITNPDTRRGRGNKMVATPVKKAAIELGLTVSHDVDDVLIAHRNEPVDLGVVVAFGRLIKAPVLAEIPMVNIHFSKLPRWRGAAPLERAILAGDPETAVSLMALEETLDTGGVYREVPIPITPATTLEQLRDTMVGAACEMLTAALADGLKNPRPQTGEVTWAAKLTPDDRRLHFELPAAELLRVIRIGGAHTTLRGRRFRILDAHVSAKTSDSPQLDPGELKGTLVGTGDGQLDLVTVQPEGKAATDAKSWVNGARLQPGERLGE